MRSKVTHFGVVEYLIVMIELGVGGEAWLVGTRLDLDNCKLEIVG